MMGIVKEAPPGASALAELKPRELSMQINDLMMRLRLVFQREPGLFTTFALRKIDLSSPTDTINAEVGTQSQPLGFERKGRRYNLWYRRYPKYDACHISRQDSYEKETVLLVATRNSKAASPLVWYQKESGGSLVE